MGIKLFMLNATDATGFQNSNNTACKNSQRIINLFTFVLEMNI